VYRGSNCRQACAIANGINKSREGHVFVSLAYISGKVQVPVRVHLYVVHDFIDISFSWMVLRVHGNGMSI
jgi:hypothetical protein